MERGPIGVFDSGIGGLTVLKALRKYLPGEDYIYLGDTARVPYGTKSPATVIRYARECARFLIDRGAGRVLVVACNTMSALALETLTETFSCPFIGTIKSTAEVAVESTRNGRIGVIGTRATIASRAFEKEIMSLSGAAIVESCACPLFVPLVEEGIFEGNIVESVIAHYLSEMRKCNIDTLVLGCTHYPLLAESLSAFFGAGVNIVSSAESVARELTRLLGSEEDSKPASAEGSVSLCVTDNLPGFSHFAAQILREDNLPVELVSLS